MHLKLLCWCTNVNGSILPSPFADASYWSIMLPALFTTCTLQCPFFLQSNLVMSENEEKMTKMLSLHRWSSCCHSVGTSLCCLRLTGSWCSWSKCRGESGISQFFLFIFLLIKEMFFLSKSLLSSHNLRNADSKKCKGSNYVLRPLHCICSFLGFYHLCATDFIQHIKRVLRKSLLLFFFGWFVVQFEDVALSGYL